jgi:hypothetical protein
MYLEIDRQTDQPTDFVVNVFVCTEELCNAHHDLQDSYGLQCLFVALWTFFHSCGLNNQTSFFSKKKMDVCKKKLSYDMLN